jgi:hypothetical protein
LALTTITLALGRGVGRGLAFGFDVLGVGGPIVEYEEALVLEETVE